LRNSNPSLSPLRAQSTVSPCKYARDFASTSTTKSG
jgi:hypothetical protein